MPLRFRGLVGRLSLAFLISLLVVPVAIADPGGRGKGNNPANRASDAPEPDDDGAVEERYIVKFRPGSPEPKGLVWALGGDVLLDLPKHNALAARLPEQARRGLENHPHVELIEVDQRRYPDANPPWLNLPDGGEVVPFGIPMVQADQLTDAAVGNRKICIIDSGYYRAHDDLQHVNVTATPDAGTGDPFVDNSAHGTHVAGTIAAIGGNGLGVRGVLPSQKINLHIVKVFGDDGAWAYSSTLAAALGHCRDAGANVVSMSLSGPSPSALEQAAFDAAYAAGVLSVAAAGNGGVVANPTDPFRYPASYASVVAVGGVDANENLYTSSQKNSQVEIAAPAVAVLSTVTSQETNTISAGGTTWAGNPVTNAMRSSGASGPIVDGGRCHTTGPWAGAVVLCERGPAPDGSTVSFLAKVQNVQSSGGVAAILYNNIPESLFATLGDGNTSTIPAIGLHQADGQAILAGALGQTATVVSKFEKPAMYGLSSFNGTSMATPHVSAVAALVWSYNPSWSNAQIRTALQQTAKDKGAAGRDVAFGFGIVQAKDARDWLCATTGEGCSDPVVPAPGPAELCFTDTSHGDFYTSFHGVNVNATPGSVRLASSGDPALDQQDVTASTSGFGFNSLAWFAQTFTAGATGQIVGVDLNLFCSGCTGTAPNLAVSIRATSGDAPVGPDLAVATIPGFNSGAGTWYSFSFASPANVTAGTRYAIVGRAVANPSAGTYAYIAAPVAQPDTYLAGRRLTSSNAGASWVVPVAGRDINFRTHVAAAPPHVYASTGHVISSTKDSLAPALHLVSWSPLSWSASSPAGTSVGFQIAASDSASGPFEFVGPDGTPATSFLTSGASLAQFDNYRYLKVKSILGTSVPDATPVLHDLAFCANTSPDTEGPVISGAAVDTTVLWPPNHQMHDVRLTWTATDDSGATPVVTLSVTSSDASNGTGDGNTSSDWEIVSNTHVRLRAERAGHGPGRTYTITITATDPSGNSSSKSLTVSAPRNR